MGGMRYPWNDGALSERPYMNSPTFADAQVTARHGLLAILTCIVGCLATSEPAPFDGTMVLGLAAALIFFLGPRNQGNRKWEKLQERTKALAKRLATPLQNLGYGGPVDWILFPGLGLASMVIWILVSWALSP
jgi:hypothetical protein